MTLDATKPNGSELGVDLAVLLLEARQQINLLWSTISISGVTPNQLVTLSGGIGYFTVSQITLTNALVSCVLAQNLSTVKGGIDGQIVRIRAQDANLTVKHDVTKIMLTGGLDLAMAQYDLLELTNVGGDGVSVDGIWQESNRYSWTP